MKRIVAHMKLSLMMALLVGAMLAAVLAQTLEARAGDPGASVQKPADVLFLVQNSKQAPVVLKTSIAMLGGKGFPARHVAVILCGQSVTALTAGGELESLLEQSAAKGVRVEACGISLEQQKVERSHLSKSVEVVDNGLVEAIRLQARGYLSVEL